LYLAPYQLKGGQETKFGIRLKVPDGTVTVGGKAGNTSKPPPKDDIDDSIPY
jgi:hypothetical protein